MVKSNIKIGFTSSAISIMIMWWLQSLLSPLFDKFNQYFIEKSTDPILRLIVYIPSVLLIKIPVYSILLFVFIALLVYELTSIVILNHKNFKIIKAEYGIGNVWCDITSRLNDFIVDNKLNIILSNSICGKDPAPHAIKIGKITYQLGKKTFTKKYKEEENVKLP